MSVNEGLALRWEAGLAEMEPTLAIPEDEREIYIDQWRQNIESEMDKFENLCLYEAGVDCKSIVSLLIASTKPNQECFNKADMTTIFKSMT